MPVWEIFVAFLSLGCTAFGGPSAHLGYFNAEFVRRRKWLDQASFAQVVGLCGALPGPTSSQVGMLIGLIRGGPLGAAAAWLGFTLPSAAGLTFLALHLTTLGDRMTEPWVHGLLVAAVAVVAAAVVTMVPALCPDPPRKIAALAAAALALTAPGSSAVQLGLIAVGALYGLTRSDTSASMGAPLPLARNRTVAFVCAAAFVALAVGLPLALRGTRGGPLQVVDAFFSAGALVFGGGHVVLPLLESRVVAPGWVGPDTFLAGYAAAQAVPGPLFCFAAFLGAAMHGPVSGIGGALLALVAIYAPSFLLIAAIVPFWDGLTRRSSVRRALAGVSAIVVGLLLAALYEPLWVNAIRAPVDVLLALAAFAALQLAQWPSWSVVIGCAAAAQLLAMFAHVDV